MLIRKKKELTSFTGNKQDTNPLNNIESHKLSEHHLNSFSVVYTKYQKKLMLQNLFMIESHEIG